VTGLELCLVDSDGLGLFPVDSESSLKLCSVDSNILGLCSVDSGSLWLVIMLKSKERFMVRPPMKIVQP
jgi:hypothetical protein